MRLPDRVEAVLLDMGGVLLEEGSSYERAAEDPALIATLLGMGIESPRELVRARARRMRDAYRALEAQCTQPDLEVLLADTPPAVRRLLLRAFADVSNLRPYPYVAGVLRRLSRRARIGLVSNTIIPGDHHRRALELAGAMRWIDAAAWSASFGRRKPDPAIVHHVLGRLGVPPRRALMVGDKIRTDVLVARRAGVRSVHLRRRGTPVTDEARPDFVIRDLRELPALLARL